MKKIIALSLVVALVAACTPESREGEEKVNQGVSGYPAWALDFETTDGRTVPCIMTADAISCDWSVDSR